MKKLIAAVIAATFAMGTAFAQAPVAAADHVAAPAHKKAPHKKAAHKKAAHKKAKKASAAA